MTDTPPRGAPTQAELDHAAMKILRGCARGAALIGPDDRGRWLCDLPVRWDSYGQVLEFASAEADGPTAAVLNAWASRREGVSGSR